MVFRAGRSICNTCSNTELHVVRVSNPKYLLKQTPTLRDGSAIVTGLLLAFNLPSNIPIWILILGSLVAIGVGKMTFGGLGRNPFNPALIGRVFMLISFPVQMTSWPKPSISPDYLQWRFESLQTVFNFGAYSPDYIDAFTGATPLGLLREGGEMPSTISLLIGNVGGSFGEIASGALLLGFVYLLVRKVITWHIPISIILSTLVFTGILYMVNPEIHATPLFHILTGGFILGAVFMATDYVTSPMYSTGMIIFGVGIGIMTVLIRVFGDYPEGMSFAILIMNAFVPLINKYIKPKRFGKEVKNG